MHWEDEKNKLIITNAKDCIIREGAAFLTINNNLQRIIPLQRVVQIYRFFEVEDEK